MRKYDRTVIALAPLVGLAAFVVFPDGPPPVTVGTQPTAPPAVDRPGIEPQVGALLGTLAEEVRIRPEDPARWLEYAETLHAHGFRDEAALCYREAARLAAPASAASLAARYLLAHVLRSSRPAEAAPLLTALLKDHRDYLPAEVLLGELLDELGDRVGAAAAFRRALVREPGAPLALFRLGSIRLAEGEPDEAIPLFERALAAAPEAGAVRAALARAWTAAGDRPRARQVLASGGGTVSGLPEIGDPIHFRMTERDVSSPRLLERARDARQAGLLEEAERWYVQLAELRPRDPIVLAEFGAVLDDQGRTGEAEPLYRDAVALSPNLFLARLGLGVLLARAGDLAAAEFQFRRALAARPEEAQVHRALGDVLLRQRQVGSALEALEEAARLDAADGAVQVLLAGALAELGRYPEAWEAVRNARELGAEVPENFLRALRAKHPEPPSGLLYSGPGPDSKPGSACEGDPVIRGVGWVVGPSVLIRNRSALLPRAC